MNKQILLIMKRLIIMGVIGIFLFGCAVKPISSTPFAPKNKPNKTVKVMKKHQVRKAQR